MPFSFDAMRLTRAVSQAVTAARHGAVLIDEQRHAGGMPLAAPPAGSSLLPVMGDAGVPGLGYSWHFIRDPQAMSEDRQAKYGPVSWSRCFGRRLVGVLSAEGAQEVLINRDKAFSQEAWTYFIGPFFERGLMLMDFEEHHHHRRIMQEAFTADRLRGYLDGMNEVLAVGFDGWKATAEFAFHPSFKQLTLDLATTVFMGRPLGTGADRVNQAFFDTIQAGTAIVRHDLPGTRWRRGLESRAFLEKWFRDELPSKRSGTGPDLFTVLCNASTDDGHSFTDDDVVNHMIFLLMAAHDTSTTTMTSLVYELARDQTWQDRLREESVALGRDAIEFDDMGSLPSMALAIKEAQRFLAPVPAMIRKTIKPTSVLGHYIPAGEFVYVVPLFIQRSEDYFSDPDQFDPDRFSDQRSEDKSHRFAFMPFGGGAHKCIGMHFGNLEVTAAMHQMLLRFRWSVDDGYRMPVNHTSLPYPPDGLPIAIERIGA